MSQPYIRYSNLRPLDPVSRFVIAHLAMHFFNVASHHEMAALIRKPRPDLMFTPFTAGEFVKFLKLRLPQFDSDKHLAQIEDILQLLDRHNLIRKVGETGDMILSGRYKVLMELSTLQAKGYLWLAPALGPEFVHERFSHVTCQITGKKAGNVCAGTGILISPTWLLTCAHVLHDVEVDEEQRVGGVDVQIRRILPHKSIDVAAIEISPGAKTLDGLAFRPPRVGEEIFTLGYPRVPFTTAPAIILHRGEVTAERVQTFDKADLFLYSAIARPGNSGGPIISSSGYVVGIASDQLEDRRSEGGKEKIDQPFYAGVGAGEILRALQELDPAIPFPWEDYN